LKKLKFIIVSFLFILFFLPKVFTGQGENKTLPGSAEELNMMLYGNSDELINGKTYYQQHPFAEGNPYFGDRWRISGTIFIKGNEYPRQVIGYDIVNEKVILSAFQRNGAQFEVELNETIIDSMIIGNTFFINSTVNIIAGFDKGFIEIIYQGDFMFVKKHKKTFMSQYSANFPNGFYTKDQGNYYIIFDSVPIQISSIKSLLNEFETHRKDIKKYMRTVKFKFKKATNQQWVNLLLYCDKLVSV
jgi:hypothetical protein